MVKVLVESVVGVLLEFVKLLILELVKVVREVVVMQVVSKF